jgi:AraC-like DNA-binding protein
MNTKLNSIQNWPERARQANWSVSKLAKLCGISRDTMRRHFLQHFGKTPKVWLAEQRQQQAIELLRNGSTIKETSACLGYKQQTNFTRQFKGYHGTCPSQPLPPRATANAI